MRPLIMGIAMGALMMWMLHGVLTGDTTLAGWALVGFVGAHVVVLVGVFLLGRWALRFSPRFVQWVARHRPSLKHSAVMGLGMLLSGGFIHAAMHGGVV